MNEKTAIKDQKAKKILDAARSILAQKGYAATTINLVASEAGVSRGLLHYYFKNKEEMLAKVIQLNLELSAQMVADLFAQTNSVHELANDLTSALRGILETDPDLFNLLLEGWSVSRHTPAVDKRFHELYSHFRDTIQNGLEDAVARNIISPALPLGGLAALLTAIIDGLGLQLVTEPDMIANERIWETARKGIRVLLGGGE